MLHGEPRSDRVRFLKSWIADPLRVAAIAPSSEHLARLITSEIDPSHAPVLELGAGTGVFTRALVDRGIAETAITIVEYGAEFAELLERRFPEARVVNASAARLASLKLFPARDAGAVVSGLPLLSMPPGTVYAILLGAFAGLRRGGCFFQFTYGPRCPVAGPILDRLGLEARRIGGTMCNLPPASVYRLSRSRDRADAGASSARRTGSRLLEEVPGAGEI